jgi:hypothetical protein
MKRPQGQPTRIELTEHQFPVYVVYRGRGGDEAVYELKQAGRKFGLSLQAVSQWLREQLLRRG